MGIECGAVRKGDASRQLLTIGWKNFKQDGAEIEQVRPFARILGSCDLAIRFVAQGKCAITKQSTLCELGFVQWLALHGLNWIAPKLFDYTREWGRIVRHNLCRFIFPSFNFLCGTPDFANDSDRGLKTLILKSSEENL